MLSKLFKITILLPICYWIYLIMTDSLGADPAKSLNHKTGEVAFYLLLLNLAIGAMISLAPKFPGFLRFLLTNRRYMGVVSFIYLVFHLALYLVLEGFEEKAFTQIVTKTYLIFGLLSWLIMLILALTSNNFSVKKLGIKKWKLVHRLVYVATFLLCFHLLLIEKADLIKYGTIFSVLWLVQIYRFFHLKRKKSKKHLATA